MNYKNRRNGLNRKNRQNVLTFVNKKGYNEYNSSRYLISAIIKNVSRNPICVE